MFALNLGTFSDVDSWWTALKKYTHEKTNYTSWQELADPLIFPRVLSDFLFDASGSRYKANFRFDGQLICNQPTPNILVEKNKFINISLTKFHIKIGFKVSFCVSTF